MKCKRKKLNVSVKKQFQMWMLVRILSVVLISVIVSGTVLYIYAQREISGSFYDIHFALQKVSDLLLPVILLGSAISFLSGLALAIFFPQKIAGPIYRIEQDLKEIKKGNLQKRIKLRKNDPLTDLVDTINDTLDSLVAQIDSSNTDKQDS